MTIHATVQPSAAASDENTLAKAAALPVTFSRTVGLYMPPKTGTASSNIAVLLVSPWGYEEMCVRKFWRILAEDLAAAGIASLRFDYPGTGDALDVTDTASGLDLWRDSILDAATQLRSLSGAGDLILVGTASVPRSPAKLLILSVMSKASPCWRRSSPAAPICANSRPGRAWSGVLRKRETA